MGKMIYAEVTANENFEPAITQVSKVNGSRVALIANTHRAIVRVADLTVQDKRLTAATQWRLVQENFPMGPQLNENTHIFDGGVFTNATKRSCFLMIAIPKAIAEPIAEIAVERWGSVHKLKRLDTIEHILFRYYTNAAKKASNKAQLDTDIENHKAQWIIFPQDLGYRILFMNDGLPHGAHYISNHPDLRAAELDRAWNTATPSHVTILSRMSDDEEAAVSDDQWLHEFLKGKGVSIDNEMFRCLSRFVIRA